MPGASRKVRRLEKEAILRSKNYEYTREVSDSFLSKLDLNVEEEEDTDRHRRHITTRPIRQIQRETDYPLESLDKITERIQQEIKRRQLASASAPTNSSSSASTTRSYQRTTSTSSSTDDRTKRDTGLTGKYSTSKPTSGGKLY